MLQDEMEEQLQSLKREVDELRAEVAERKRKTPDDEPLLPGVEYDFVPKVVEKNTITITARITGVIREPSTLGLTDEEWELYSSPDE